MAVKWNDAAFKASVRSAIMRGVVEATEGVRAEAVSLILNPPKTGRIHHRRGVEHQASAPGEAPASDTGRLAAELDTVYDTQNLTGTVVSRSPYGPYLEFGTQKMEARPFLRPALNNRAGETLRIMQDALKRGSK